ncbi:hypothetical protein Efla_003296 [Eimeria flavescens]
MARASINALMDGEASRQREHNALKNKVATLEGQLKSHAVRTSEAEAAARECRTRLLRLQASRNRLAEELLQIKREAEREAALKQYSVEASLMTESKAVEFLHDKCGVGDISRRLAGPPQVTADSSLRFAAAAFRCNIHKCGLLFLTACSSLLKALSQGDLDKALRMQHGKICQLQSENARLRSEKLAQRRHFKAEVERREDIRRQQTSVLSSAVRTAEPKKKWVVKTQVGSVQKEETAASRLPAPGPSASQDKEAASPTSQPRMQLAIRSVAAAVAVGCMWRVLRTCSSPFPLWLEQSLSS